MRVLNILRNVGLEELIIQFITEDQWHIFGLCSRSMKWLLECMFHKKRRISSQQLNICSHSSLLVKITYGVF